MTYWKVTDTVYRSYRSKPYEFTASPAEIVEYLNSLVRSALKMNAAIAELDMLITSVLQENLEQSQRLGRRFGLYFAEEDTVTE